MKKILIALLFVFLCALVHAQRAYSDGFVGLGIGSESGWVFPKLGIRGANFEKHPKLYTGADLGIWLFFTFYMSATAYMGCESEHFIAELSTGIFYLPRSKEYQFGPYFQWSTTPKVGIKFRTVAIKSGIVMPLWSYKDSSTYAPLSGFRWNHVLLNLELVHYFDWDEMVMTQPSKIFW